MEVTSASLHWRGLLLTASLLTYWNSAATAQVTVDADPPSPAEGKNVLLRVHNLPEKLHVFYWYKGRFANENEIARFTLDTSTNKSGPAYSGRETIYSNGSLLIREVTQNDTGTYILYMVTEDYDNDRASMMFQVHEPVTPPSIQVSNTTVKELGSVLLTCFSNATGISLLWLFNGQTLGLTDRMKLSQDNSTLSIDPVRREDSGEYQCEISNPVSSKRSDPIRLDIIIDPTQGLSGGAIAGIVVGAVAGVTLIAALAYFLYTRKTGRSRPF